MNDKKIYHKHEISRSSFEIQLEKEIKIINSESFSCQSDDYKIFDKILNFCCEIILRADYRSSATLLAEVSSPKFKIYTNHFGEKCRNSK